MSESRRDFLQRLAASAAALALDPFAGIRVTDDVYRNQRLRLTVRRPPGWEFSSIADFAALRDRQVLRDVLGDEPHPLKDPANLPVFLFENPAFREAEFAPGISLFDEPLPGPVPADELMAHHAMLEGFGAAYRDVQIIDSACMMSLDGAEATLSRWSYRHELAGCRHYVLLVQSVVVFREPRVHTYHLVDGADAPRIDERVWSDFIDSIHYDVN